MLKFKILLVLVINFCLVYNYSTNYDDQSGNQLKISPEELMVDTTNSLAFKILYLHSFSNKNNFGFSPCGLASVLIALFEGSDGKSAIEIHQAMELPWDRDIVRIGFRDIHRRLRTYFYHEENILSGLSLSRENVTIRPEFETILRFYGYEVDSLAMKAEEDDDESEKKTTELPIVIENREPEDDELTTVNTESNIETTTEQMNSTEGKTEIKTELPTTTMLPVITSTIVAETTTNIVTTTTEPTTTLISTTPSVMTTTTDAQQTTTLQPESTTYIFTFKPLNSRTTEDPLTSTITYPTRIPVTTTELPDTTTETFPSTRARSTRGSRQLIRYKRSSNKTNVLRLSRSPMEYEITSYDLTPNYFYQVTPYPQYPEYVYETRLVPPTPEPQKPTDETVVSHFFYLNHYEQIQVPYKFYNTILKFAYIENIRTSVLELELDSEDYSLIIMIPDYEYGLNNLLKALKSEYAPSLRNIKKQMKPAWVKAIVPKFNLKGNIILTSDLQNLGVNDIFEPTHADFTPMTEDKHIYARHVEQSVTLNIRTQPVEQLKRQTMFYKSPVEISVNHPFLFFIVDTEMDLALIAGRILNPLNSRIQ